MANRLYLASALVSSLALAACGGGGGSQVDADPDRPDSDPNAPDADPSQPDAAAGYVPLIRAQWSLPPGQEGYICATKTMTEDVYAGTLRPIAPLGTHHTVIGLNATPDGPDNPSFPCGPEFGEFWASGAGTPELVLPDGVGLLAPAGSQLRLSLHLFNAGDTTLSGNSGLDIKPLAASEVVHTASVDYHGPFAFSIPNNNQPYTSSQNTTLGARTLVAIFPHMHQLGTHFRATLQHGSDPAQVLWDDAYQFESQEFAPLPSIPVQAGDVLRTSCTWVNDTGSNVGWGDSSNQEMCFSILMSY
jgi:hypothetical protein